MLRWVVSPSLFKVHSYHILSKERVIPSDIDIVLKFDPDMWLALC